MPPQWHVSILEAALFSLEDVLRGVQPAESRREPQIPAAFQQKHFADAAIDSREVVPNTLFVALTGARVDGHQFLGKAVENGARAALVQRGKINASELPASWALIEPDGTGLDAATPESVVLIAVDDPLAAFQRLGAYHRSLFTPTVIGITGSVGKTSTKEVMAAVLQRKYRTLKNPRSYNNESTLPIVLMQMDSTHDVAVLEMGIYGPGDLALLTSLARPHIGVVTNVGPSHMERMGSLEAVAAAKSELVQALPADGYAILNIDDERVRAMAQQTAAQPFFYGLDPAADLWADEIESKGLDGITFRAHHAGESVHLRLPLLGRHSVHTALAATAAGLLLGMGWDAIIDGLRDQRAQLRLLAVPGANSSTLIDDTYNASPVSSLAALNLLSDLGGRRIVVHGDMMELGAAEESAHRRVGGRVAEVADRLVVVGQRARWIAEEAHNAGMASDHILIAASNDDAAAALRQLLQPGDYVLVKGSRSAAMESIVAALQHRPEAKQP